MKPFEYEAKEVLKKYNIPVPDGVLIEKYEPRLSVRERDDAGLQFFRKNKPVVLKAQVLSGGRGKAGGISFVETEEEFWAAIQRLFSIKISGLEAKKILIEKKLDFQNEIYLGFSISRSDAKIVMLLSKEGGIEIEETSKKSPDTVIVSKIDITEGLDNESIKEAVKKLEFEKEISDKISIIAFNLYKVFTDYECEVAEINPLVVTRQGNVIAADVRISIYDEAISKHQGFLKEEETYTELEKRARKQGLGYVEMNGDIGVLGNGAGLNMATLDILTHFGARPANFLEVSGRTYNKAKEALEIIISNPAVKIIFGNFFGCISRCDVIARGIAEAVKSGIVKVPMVIAMKGTGAKEGIEILKGAGLSEIYEDDIVAGERVVKLKSKLKSK
ncbi:MAG: ATP-grasp domain-containing protein [Elusimicrobiota bacterium]